VIEPELLSLLDRMLDQIGRDNRMSLKKRREMLSLLMGLKLKDHISYECPEGKSNSVNILFTTNHPHCLSSDHFP
jgi:hypothetical protein